MSGAPKAATPLFVDTGAFYARFITDDENHGRAMETFEAIRTGSLQYRPLFTSRYVLSEVTRLLLHYGGHDAAVRALAAIRESDTFTVLPVAEQVFDNACGQFERYDDQEISLTDHVSATVAEEYDVECVFSFDDDFRTLGFTCVPRDVRVPEAE